MPAELSWNGGLEGWEEGGRMAGQAGGGGLVGGGTGGWSMDSALRVDPNPCHPLVSPDQTAP